MVLTREKFREAVFERDGFSCINCGDKDAPLDAHHIMERRLFPDGGYYLNNGATLCDKGLHGCHYKAETTELSVNEILDKIGAKRVTPPDLYPDHEYDKWGNSILSNGMRTKGPLFHDESVQKVLEGCIHLFTDYVKYGRTYHLPWSQGITDDDKVLKDVSDFEGKRVVVTRKMDGENTSMYYDGYLHARSVDGRSHVSRDWAKAFWAHRFFELPEGWRVVAENLYAKHAIYYKNLPSYVLGFAIYDELNFCLSWDETIEYFKMLDIEPVEVLYDGVFDSEKIKSLYVPDRDYDSHEGYVVRIAGGFPYGDFTKCVAKFVRQDHVVTTKHWIKQDMIPNDSYGKINR